MCSENFADELARRINFGCDRITPVGQTVYFHFDSVNSWEAVFQELIGVYDAVIKAFTLGFTKFIFVRYDGEEYRTEVGNWIPSERPVRRRR